MQSLQRRSATEDPGHEGIHGTRARTLGVDETPTRGVKGEAVEMGAGVETFGGRGE